MGLGGTTRVPCNPCMVANRKRGIQQQSLRSQEEAEMGAGRNVKCPRVEEVSATAHYCCCRASIARHVLSASLSETVFICNIGEREYERFFYKIMAGGSEPTYIVVRLMRFFCISMYLYNRHCTPDLRIRDVLHPNCTEISSSKGHVETL